MSRWSSATARSAPWPPSPPEVFNLTGRGDPEQITSARVSWRFFDVLGVAPAKGRGFRAEEDKPGGDRW